MIGFLILLGLLIVERISTYRSDPYKKIVESLGLVRGNTVRARHLGRDILAELLAFGTAVVVEDEH